VSLEQALASLQGLSRELFGLETSEASDFPNQWHGSVRCLEAGPRGAIYLDLLQRPGKVPQPCTFQLQFDVGNSRSAQSRNVCAVVASIGDPRSLTPYEVL
jgi:Zn-dependent oligopeptidase